MGKKRANSRSCGFSFISVIISVFILAAGMITLLRVYPVVDRLSVRSENFVSMSLIADRLFTVIEQVYGGSNSPVVPACFHGVDEEFPLYEYNVSIYEE